jgi:hypothetical protein
MPKLAANALVQFRGVSKHPAGNGGMVHAKIPLGHHLFQIAVTERIA